MWPRQLRGGAGAGRVHTTALPVVSELAPLYAGADQGAIAALLAKLGVERSLHQKLDQVRSELQLRVMQARPPPPPPKP